MCWVFFFANQISIYEDTNLIWKEKSLVYIYIHIYAIYVLYIDLFEVDPFIEPLRTSSWYQYIYMYKYIYVYIDISKYYYVISRSKEASNLVGPCCDSSFIDNIKRCQ